MPLELFLPSAIKRLAYYKELADKTFAQLEEKDFRFQPNPESNSIAIIIQHMAGNMMSRWTDLLETDGEKEWRKRDAEFEEQELSKGALIQIWEEGWRCCFNALNALQSTDLGKTVYIRDEPLSVLDAINRQLAHYPYHVGQIVYIAKMIVDEDWVSLSIPRKK